MSDIKPVLERVSTSGDIWNTESGAEEAHRIDARALAACVRDLAEAARIALPSTWAIGERRRCWTCQHYHTYREVGDRRSWAACDNSECRCSTLVENPKGFIVATLAKWGLSEGSEG